MKPLWAEVTNFGSYPHLRVEFGDMGLALIYGPTGAGKSTLMDIIPWVLLGKTAKGGGVAEVRSWQAEGESTTGTAKIQVRGVGIQVYRIRGTSGKNDLFWVSDENPTLEVRGKDLADTQKRLETVLGVSADTYLSSAYFHEFSQAATFFTSKPKAQAELFEGVASLEFATGLAHRASEARKVAKKALEVAEREKSVLTGRLEALAASKKDTEWRLKDWDDECLDKVKDYTEKFNNFEVTKAVKLQALAERSALWAKDTSVNLDQLTDSLLKAEAELLDPALIDAQIKALTDHSRCQTCKALPPTTSAELSSLAEKKAVNAYKRKTFEHDRERLRALSNTLNPYDRELVLAKQELNGWAAILETTKQEINPFVAQREKINTDIDRTYTSVLSATLAVDELLTKVDRLSLVYDLSFELRGQLLRKAVAEIQDSTNRYLHDYFDAEIKVEFSIEKADSMEVRLQKSGYDCVYTQLSKGQRQLLRLAFGISVMKASANAAGAHFDTLMFDESLDGLDPNMKVKAFRLFEHLSTEHQNVLVIDHAVELQDLFSTKFQVSMTGDYSEMEKLTA